MVERERPQTKGGEMSKTLIDVVCVAIEALDEIMAIGSEPIAATGDVQRAQLERVQKIARTARSKMGDRILDTIKGMK